MDELKVFKKIVTWMISKGDIPTNIASYAGLTSDQYIDIIDRDSPIKSSRLKGLIQDFNKKYHEQMLADLAVDKLPEAIKEEKKDKMREEPAKEEKVDTAVSEPAQMTEKKEGLSRADQEREFSAILQKLRDACPEHLAFDITIRMR